MRSQAQLEGITGIRDRDFKEWLHLASKRISSTIFGKTIRMEIVKRMPDLLSGFEK
jgi:hypothetical protein